MLRVEATSVTFLITPLSILPGRLISLNHDQKASVEARIRFIMGANHEHDEDTSACL